MILIELQAIGINILFGIFFFISVNTFSFYEVKIKNFIIINIIYLIITTLLSILYIYYLDKLLFSFNFYYLFFLILGFFISSKIKYFKTEKALNITNYMVLKLLIIVKKVFLFLINYSFWRKLVLIIKNKR